jgi:CO dehydrogenase nickel-insertion accessory protein CooC1
MSNEDESDIKVVVVASAGKGKTTMCGLITEILSAHGFNVMCTDEDLAHQHINVMDDPFKERLDTLLSKNPVIEVTSQQARRPNKGPTSDKDWKLKR